MLFLSALVSFSFEDNTGSTEVILDVEHIAIDFSNPLKLYLHNDTDEGYFKEGDGLNVSIVIEESSNVIAKKLKGKFKNLKMIFTNLETGEEFEVLSQDFAQTIKFGDGGADTGNYSLKITGTKFQTPMSIKITKYNGTPLTEEEQNQPHDMVRIESMYIGELPEMQPRFFLPLNEGDKISVTTSSPLAIKFKRENDGMLFNVPQPELAATNTETWKLLFNLELEDKKGFLKLRTSNKRFIDLRIRRYPYIDPASGGANGGVAGGANGSGEGGANGTGTDGQAEDPMAKLMAEMGKTSSDNSANMMKTMAEMQAAMLKSIEEMNKKTFKSKPAFVTGSSEEEDSYVVAPRLDLTGKNRFCKKIEFSDKGLYWAYWLGVGKQSKELYSKTQETTLKRNNSGTLSLVEHYASYITENVNKKVNHPGFTMIKNRMASAGEFVEYAIVDELNKEKFEGGLKYSPVRSGWAKRNAVVDHGNSSFIESSDLFLCLCNENKMSPVDVYFKYEVYNLEKVQQ